MDERTLTAWLIREGILHPTQIKDVLESQLRLQRSGERADIIEVCRRQNLLTDIQVLEVLEKTGYKPPRPVEAPRATAPAAVKLNQPATALASPPGGGDEDSGSSEAEQFASQESQVTPIPAAEVAKPNVPSAKRSSGARRRSSGARSSSAARRLGGSAEQRLARRSRGAPGGLLVAAFVAPIAIVALLVVPKLFSTPEDPSGNGPRDEGGGVATLQGPAAWLKELQEGVDALKGSSAPRERKADIRRLQGLVARLQGAEGLMVSQVNAVDAAALYLDGLEGKPTGGRPPANDELKKARVDQAWRRVANSFERTLLLCLQQPPRPLQQAAEVVRGVDLRKQVQDTLSKVRGKGSDAVVSLVGAKEIYPVLGVGGYESLLKDLDRFPDDLRDTKRWEKWDSLEPHLEDMLKLARAYGVAMRVAEAASEEGDLQAALGAFSGGNHADDPWFKAVRDYLGQPQVVAAFEARQRAIASGDALARREVLPTAGDRTRTRVGSAHNWRERFLALEGDYRKAKDDDARREGVVKELEELLAGTEELARRDFGACTEMVELFDERPKVFKAEATLKARLKKHHEIYFEEAFARASGPGSFRALDRWCAEHGYEAWRVRLRPYLRLVAAAGGKAGRAREAKRRNREQAKVVVKKFADERLASVIEGLTDVLKWMRLRGYAPPPAKEELDGMIARAVQRAGDPVAGGKLRQDLAALTHKAPAEEEKKLEEGFRKQVDQVIKTTVSRSLKAVEKCISAGEYGLAFDLFGYVLLLDPENDRAHKGLGHVKVEDRWLRRFDAERMRAGFVWDSQKAWVLREQDERYAKGEIYCLQEKKWAPLAEENQKHSDPANPWVIVSEHFELRSTAPLHRSARTIERIEAFYLAMFRQYDLFFLAKGGAKLIFGMSPSQSKPLVVNFYKDMQQFREHANPPTDWAAGFYSGGHHASFFPDSNGWTILQHELTHQILGETSPGHAWSWLAEGAAVYLEDAFFRDGSLTLGERQDHSRVVSYERRVRNGEKEHSLIDMLRFKTGREWDSGDISQNYRGAGAVVYFFCNFDNGRYRSDFVEFLKAAYYGQNPRLEDFFGVPVEVLNALMERFYNPNAELKMPGSGKVATAEELSGAADAMAATCGAKEPDLDQIAVAYGLLKSALAGASEKQAKKARSKASRALLAARKKQAKKVETAIRGSVSASAMKGRWEELERLRAEALAVINDPARYPDANHGKAGQHLVDAAVGQLTQLWEELPDIFSDPEVAASIELLEMTEPWLVELEIPDKKRRPNADDLRAELVRAAGIKNLHPTPADQALQEQREKIYAYNDSLADVPEDARAQVRVLNEYRRMLGLHALAIDVRLYQAADKHSAWMEQSGQMTHDEPDPARRTPTLRAQLEGYVGGVGENVAFGYRTPESVHNGWYNSSGHHRNMIGKGWYQIGVARAGTYWTQVFGSGKPSLP